MAATPTTRSGEAPDEHSRRCQPRCSRTLQKPGCRSHPIGPSGNAPNRDSPGAIAHHTPHLAPPTLAQMPISPMSLYQVVGRKAPTEAEPMPPAYRMKLFAPNAVIAKVGSLSAAHATATTI